jgi:hypothetical protein
MARCGLRVGWGRMVAGVVCVVCWVYMCWQDTALHLAAQGGRREVVDFLVSEGASLAAQNEDGVSMGGGRDGWRGRWLMSQ